MKFKFLLFISILVFSHSKMNAFRLFHVPDTTRIIVKCTVTDGDKMYALKKTMINDPQMKVVSFCNNHSVFLVKFFGTASEADVKIYDIRKQHGLSLGEFNIREYNFGDIEQFCIQNDPYFLTK